MLRNNSPGLKASACNGSGCYGHTELLPVLFDSLLSKSQLPFELYGLMYLIVKRSRIVL